MKKIVLLVLAFIALKSYSQEQFNVGVNGGLTVDSAYDVSNFAFGADANYLFDVSDYFIVGPSLAFTYFMAEDSANESGMFLPISAAFRFHSLDDLFYAGTDVGYAVSISDYDGGVYIKPIVGCRVTDSFKINAFYAGLRNGDYSFGYAGLGLVYDFLGAKNGSYDY